MIQPIAKKGYRTTLTAAMNLLGLLPDHCYLVQSDLWILDVNESVLRDLAVPRDEIVGKKFHPMASEECREPLSEMLHRLTQPGSVRNVEISCDCDNRTRIFAFSGVRIAGTADGEADVHLLIGHDISDLAERAEKHEYQALHDPLTGAFNRWYLDELLRREAQRGKRYDHPIAFLMIDVDHFKKINDNYGHHVGDDALRWISRRLFAAVRQSDFVVRFGGDEFLIVMPETGAETEIVQQRIEQAVADPSDKEAHPFLPVTVSIGGACWTPNDTCSITDVIEKADCAMYESRGLG